MSPKVRAHLQFLGLMVLAGFLMALIVDVLS